MRTGESKSAVAKLSLCAFRVGEETFGVEPYAVREALRKFQVRAVPLAPRFVAGVLPYRGEMLLAVSLRAVLGLAPAPAPCAIVLGDAQNGGESGELFALLIDGLADVVQVAASEWEPNPPTLDARRSTLFRGAYRTDAAPLVRLDPARLQPSWLMRQESAAPGGPQ